MSRYVIRRLLLIIPTLFVISVVIFAMIRIAPGDPAVVYLSRGGPTAIDPVELAEFREEHGLNRPLVAQYGSWLWGLARFEGGISLWSSKPVFEEISTALPATVELAIISTLIALVIAVPAGLISAIRRDSTWDYGFRAFGLTGLAMPDFFTGSMLLLILVIFFQWIPPLEYHGFFEDPIANLGQMIWPALILGHIQAALISRMIRSTTLEVLQQDYVRTATAKGLRNSVVYLRHAFRNALLPVVTVAGVQFGQVLGGAVIVENIFAIPGIGFKLLDAVQHRDFVLLQTIVVLFALAIMLVNLLVDLLYGLLDPRIRYS